MFLGFLYLVTFADEMGVQVPHLSNGPFRKRCIDHKRFLYPDYSLNSDKLQLSVAQDLLLF